jgi:hypothetical protein
VPPQQMGVATSAATFFRQIGGTLGTAILLSVLFSLLPTNIVTASSDQATLKPALSAALNPAVADKAGNRAIMKQLWTPIVGGLEKGVQQKLDAGAATAKAEAGKAVTEKVTAAVQAQVDAGVIPAAAAPAIIEKQVAAATPDAEAAALAAVAEKAHATVSGDTVKVDWTNASQRAYWVDQLTPTVAKQIKDNSKAASASSSSTSDTSFLNGADPRLTKPFLVGFNASTIVIYWVALGVILVAFVLTWFFRVPPLRSVSALQERANAAGVSDTGTIQTV